MAFEQRTRNLLQRTVTACRRIFDLEFTAQLQELYGIQPDGSMTPYAELDHLADEELEVALLLRSRINHFEGGSPLQVLTRTQARPEHVARVIREQAFTVLNRLAALRLCEERGIVLECVRRGTNSEGFQLFLTSAGNALGETHEAYCVYLHSVFDELALDLGVLFDRFSPLALLFPRRDALEKVLCELNGSGRAAAGDGLTAEEFADIWEADETIGWIYQYYNDETERKKMREDSPAPRDSRELAVRNQFFTPRYVVEFLTDNTLGCLWYEMTRGRTALSNRCRYLVRWPTEIFLKPDQPAPENNNTDAWAAGNLSEDELQQEPVYIPYRPLKDPREIRLLDPACGSMHFGLYAFDLFAAIYDEAWDIAHGQDDTAKALETFAPFTDFAASFPDKESFLLEVPRLIIDRNIHGLDIDPRATQIAGLSLWLRAQRAWHRAGVKPVNRPRITRSNVVCAEPMPGEKELLRDFVEQQFVASERPAFAFLLEKIFDSMTLAGEAGSLLRIELEIRSIIAEASALAQRRSAPRQAQLWTGAAKPEQSELDLRGLNDEQFWHRAEQRIYEALQAYAHKVESGGGFQRRLFADDAAQGFAFIDLCRNRYDVVVMNPPFGSFTVGWAKKAKLAFGRLANDIYASFVRRMGEMLLETGKAGIISSRSFVTGRGMEALRPHLLGEGGTWLRLLWDLGVGVLDGAMVETAAYTYSRSAVEPGQPVTFWNDKAADKSALRFPSSERISLRSYSFIRSLPSQQFIYEADKNVVERLNSDFTFDPDLGRVTKGLSTCSNERFVRCLWEVPQTQLGKRWEFLSKGGEYRWLSCDLHLALSWAGDGHELAVFSEMTNGNSSRARQSSSHYFKPAVCFSGRSQKGFSARWLPANCIFDTKSPVVVPMDAADLPWIPPILMSAEYQRLISLQSKFGSYDTSAIGRLPLPLNKPRAFEQHLHAIWHPFLRLERAAETTWYFANPPVDVESLAEEAIAALSTIDSLLSSSGLSLDPTVRTHTTQAINSHDCFVDPAGRWFSYAIGCTFGRWDIRYATGELAAPELPDPVTPLSVCPPGMLQSDDGMPLCPEAGRQLFSAGLYPLDVAWEGIVVDDPEHPFDLERQVHSALTVLWAGRADALKDQACSLLQVPSLREWFRRPGGFFADHLKRYSKSRRQAPIYWPLSTASGHYTLWLYYHRLTPDSLFKCLERFVIPKLANVEKDITRLSRTLDANEGGAKERKRLEELEFLRRELNDLRNELEFWAPRWKPNLNDGVLISAAPLWKLFRLPKWQNDLKTCWQALERGEYDWAHLAYTLWPDRVREKCKTDRSIAIAHGLEDLCEVKARTKKVRQTRTPQAESDQQELPNN